MTEQRERFPGPQCDVNFNSFSRNLFYTSPPVSLFLKLSLSLTHTLERVLMCVYCCMRVCVCMRVYVCVCSHARTGLQDWASLNWKSLPLLHKPFWTTVRLITPQSLPDVIPSHEQHVVRQLRWSGTYFKSVTND